MHTVTVIGANGAMGRNISGILAQLADAKVYMLSRSLDKSGKAIEKVLSKSEKDISGNLIPADYSMLGACIENSDLVIESIVEDLPQKLALMRTIAPLLPSNTICATNTSGLSVTALAQALPEKMRGNFVGTHFFNPPTHLTLCELIYTKYNSEATLSRIEAFLTGALKRTTVKVKDSPAFLGNRIGFQFINEALQYADRFSARGGIDYIDSILGPFSGRTMAPLLTSDFVGIDVHKAIVDNLYENTRDYARETFVMPAFAQKLIEEGRLGKKAGYGFYSTQVQEDGSKKYLVYDIESGEYRDRKDYGFAFAKNMVGAFASGAYEEGFAALKADDSKEAMLLVEFLLKYVLYALYAAQSICTDVHAADDAMASGYGWCPPFAMIRALGGHEAFYRLVSERLGDAFAKAACIDELPYKQESKYDYRQFIKAKY